jgi:Na+-transporting methylmalonyl-CoA/oxaloacetate decarboxylase gamma subunit
MTLRLVSDNSEPDGVLYCQRYCRDEGVKRPATILVKFCSRPYMPSCDACARYSYERWPDHTAMAPLAGYVDMFAAAREAALASPEQITGQAGSPPDLAEQARAVEQYIARDQAVYCFGRLCLLSGKFMTPADVLVRANGIEYDGQPWTSLCNVCLDSHQADGYGWHPDEIRSADDEEAKASILRPANGTWQWPEPHEPMTLRARLVTGASVLAGFTGGVAMCSIANTLNAGYINALNNSNYKAVQPHTGALEGWGIFFIVVSVLAGLIWLIVEVVKRVEAESKPVPVFVPVRRAAPRQQGYAAQQGHAGPWYTNPDVVTAAAMGGAAIAAHEAAKLHREHVAERRAADRQRQAAIRAHSQQLTNENLQRQDNAAAGFGYRTNDQVGYGALAPRLGRAVPGRHTPRSDIYGNLI